MRRWKITTDDGDDIGNIYEYRRGYYHNSRTGQHGPFKSQEAALTEWAHFWRKDLRFIACVEDGKPSPQALEEIRLLSSKPQK